MTSTTLIRLAAFFLWTTAVGFGVFCIPANNNVRNGREIPIVPGYPAYGRGPFERHGMPTTVPLLSGFLVVCLLEALAGWLIWNGQRSGALLALALLPFGAVFWWGFALPVPPILAVIRTVVIVTQWKALS